MRNLKFIFAASLFFAALSCEKVETPSTTPVSDSEDGLVTLTISTGESTKTHISNVTDANGVTEIHWDEGDAIKVFTDENYWDSNAFSFSMSDTPNGNFAKFSGEIASKSTKFWAVYPDKNAKSCSIDGNGSDIVVSIPSLQSAKAASFASNLNISVAKGEIKEVDNGTLGIGGKYELTETIFVNFKNVCSLLKFTAPANASEITSVTISSNEVIAGEMTIDYSGEEPKVTGVSGSKSITMTGSFVGGQDYYFVVAPVSISGISMTIQANGETSYVAKPATTTLTPGVVKSLGTVDLAKMTKVSATAAHQSPKNVLSGTDVTFDLGQASASSLNLTVKKTDNTATRSATALKSAYSSDSDWPYLPQGAYTFSGSFSSNGVNVTVPATSFSVPAPSGLSVAEFTPFTSYTKYAAGKPVEANALDGSTIYVDITININSSIVGNTNYSDVILVNGSKPVYNADKTCVCFGGNDWKSHTISQITWTFDGVTASHTLTAAKTVDVTGIPYDYSFRNKTLADIRSDNWTPNGDANIFDLKVLGQSLYKGLFLSSRTLEGGLFGWGATEVKKKGYMVSRSFHIPGNINLQASVSTTGYVSVGGERTVKGYLGAVSSATQKCDTETDAAISFTTPCSMKTSTGGSGVWYSVQFQTSKNRLCIASEQVTDNNGNIYHFLNEAHLRYAE